MKSIFLLILAFTISVLPAFAGESPPEWMVKIVKTTEEGKRVESTGYIVEIDGRRLVRSTAHGVLGAPENLQIFDFKGRQIRIFSDQYITNNRDDDFLIQIDSKLQPLGIFDYNSGLFKIPKRTYRKIEDSENRVNLEDYRNKWENRDKASFFIAPPWLNEKMIDRKYRINSFDSTCECFSDYHAKSVERSFDSIRSLTSPMEDMGYEEGRAVLDKLDYTYNPRILKARGMKLVPGESGSPVITWKMSPTLNEGEEVVGYSRFEGDVVLIIEMPDGSRVRKPQSKEFPYISSHFMHYHHEFGDSSFLSIESLPEESDIARLYIAGVRGDISQTKWHFKNNNFYRTTVIDGKLISEIVTTNLSGGNGTTGSGGNGYQSKTTDFKHGIQVDNEQVVSLKLVQLENDNLPSYIAEMTRSGNTITATWENLNLLRNYSELMGDKKIFEYITVDGSKNELSDRLLDYRVLERRKKEIKNRGSSNWREELRELTAPYFVRERKIECLINPKKLADGVLSITMHDTQGMYWEKVHMQWPIGDVPPLVKDSSPIGRDPGKFDGAVFDLTNLWGADLSSLSIKQKFRSGRNIPFIKVKLRGKSNYVDYGCAIPSEEYRLGDFDD